MNDMFQPAAYDPQQEMQAPQIEIRYCLDESSPSVEVHSHAHYEIYFFCAGDLERYVVGNRSYRLQRGDLLLIPPRVMHHPVFQENARRYERYVFWCSQSFFTRLEEQDKDISFAFLPCLEREEYLLRFPSPASIQVLETHLRLMWNESKEDGLCKGLALEAAATHFLVLLNRNAAGALHTNLHDTESPLLVKILEYIHQHYGEPITLQETAGRFFVSASTVEHLFRQKLGCSFYRYVTKRRMAEAKSLITAGVSVKEVSQACGFGDYSNFYKAFTREVGTSPSQFRRMASTAQGLFE